MASDFRAKNLVLQPKKLPDDQLPTESGVIQAILYEKENSDVGPNQIFVKIALEIEQLWTLTTIPIIKQKSIVRKVNVLYTQYTKQFKSVKRATFEPAHQEFVDKAASQLFHICSCKCEDVYQCSCPRDSKVPKNEREFLIDQKSIRDMYFSCQDEQLTEKFERSQLRKIQCKSSSQPNIAVPVINRGQAIAKRASANAQHSPIIPKRLKMDNVAPMLDRSSVSDRVGANLVNATLKDITKKWTMR